MRLMHTRRESELDGENLLQVSPDGSQSTDSMTPPMGYIPFIANERIEAQGET